MSTAARSARPATRRPSSGGAAARAAARRRDRITVVPASRPAVAGNGVFALVVVGMLVGGMLLLLVLNTSLAQGAFEIGTLSQAQGRLAVQEEELLQDVARAEAPEALQRRADQLGMVPVTSPVFLRLADGAVLGIPKPAQARTTVPVRGTTAAGTTATTTKATTSATSKATTKAATTGTAARTDAAQLDAVPVTDAAKPDSGASP